jgi:hypothetical protein
VLPRRSAVLLTRVVVMPASFLTELLHASRGSDVAPCMHASLREGYLFSLFFSMRGRKMLMGGGPNGHVSTWEGGGSRGKSPGGRPALSNLVYNAR